MLEWIFNFREIEFKSSDADSKISAGQAIVKSSMTVIEWLASWLDAHYHSSLTGVTLPRNSSKLFTYLNETLHLPYSIGYVISPFRLLTIIELDRKYVFQGLKDSMTS